MSIKVNFAVNDGLQLNGNTLSVGNTTTNVMSNSTTIFVGNSTVNLSINSTSFSGTSNNALYLGGTSAAGYQTTAGLSGNVATLTSNNALYLGGTLASGYQTTAGLAGNVATLTSNNSNYLGGTAAAGYQTTAGLAGNVATLTSNNASYLSGQLGSYYQPALGFTPVQQGGGTGQGANKLYMGWDGASSLLLQVDVTNFSNIWPINIAGNANNSTYLGGLSLSTIEGYITGNAATAYSNAVSTASVNTAAQYTWTNTHTFTVSPVTLSSATDAQLLMSGANAHFKHITYLTDGSNRWDIGVNNTGETGGNAGSDFYLNRFSDTGSYIDTPFQVARANGTVSIGTLAVSSISGSLSLGSGAIYISPGNGIWNTSNSNTYGINYGGGTAWNSGANFVAYSQAAGAYFTWLSNGSEVARLDGYGNFGIGTSSPSCLLDVNGDIRAMRSAGASGVVLLGSSGSAYLYFDSYTYYLNQYQLVVGSPTSGGDIQVAVKAQNAAYLRLYGQSYSSYNGVLSIDNSTGIENWFVGGPAVLSTLSFRVAGSERMRIEAGGDVNIGTATNNGSLLNVAGRTWSKGFKCDFPANGGISTTNSDITQRVDSGFWQTSSANTATGWPVTTNSWYHLISSTHYNDANYFSMQLAADFYSQNLYYRSTDNSGTTAWSQVLTGNNLEYVTPQMYGAAGNGTTDDTAALTSALNSGKPVLLVGKFLITSAISLTLTNGQGVCVMGAGAQISQIVASGSTANLTFNIDYASSGATAAQVVLRDFSFMCTYAGFGTTTNAMLNMKLINPVSGFAGRCNYTTVIQNITFLTNGTGWNHTCLYLQDMRYCDVKNINIPQTVSGTSTGDTAIGFQTSNTDPYENVPTVIRFTDCNINNGYNGITFYGSGYTGSGLQIDPQGVWITNCQIIGQINSSIVIVVSDTYGNEFHIFGCTFAGAVNTLYCYNVGALFIHNNTIGYALGYDYTNGINVNYGHAFTQGCIAFNNFSGEGHSVCVTGSVNTPAGLPNDKFNVCFNSSLNCAGGFPISGSAVVQTNNT